MTPVRGIAPHPDLSLSELGIKTIFDLSELANQKDEWVLDGLIEKGDQVLLAGAPKTGKSLLALQIGLAVASGGSIFGWRAGKASKVLYINLEIREKWFSRRVNSQIDVAQVGEKIRETYFQFFSFSIASPINILSQNGESYLNARISAIQPDLIVFDVFSRLHSAEETDPIEMRNVMTRIRDLAQGAAHLVVIHTRKPDGKQSGPQNAFDIKGSVAILGECDTAMVLSKFCKGEETSWHLNVEARNVAGGSHHLKFDPVSLSFRPVSGGQSKNGSKPNHLKIVKRGEEDDDFEEI